MNTTLLHLFVSLSLFITTSSFVMHEYYVSITNVFVNYKSNQLEIEIKIDADDFEKVLKKENALFDIENITTASKTIISKYIDQNFVIWINGGKKQLEIIGTELKEDGDFNCYILIDFPSVLNSIKIDNKLLLPAFLQQHNIVNIKAKQKTQSHTFIHQHTLHTFKIDAK